MLTAEIYPSCQSLGFPQQALQYIIIIVLFWLSLVHITLKLYSYYIFTKKPQPIITNAIKSYLNINIQTIELSKQDQLDIAGRTIGVINGTVLVILSIRGFLNSDSYIAQRTQQQELLIYALVGYFIYDLIFYCYHKMLPYQLIIHHILISAAVLNALYLGFGLKECCAVALVCQLCNPASNVVGILLRLKVSKSNYFLKIWKNIYKMLYVIPRGIILPIGSLLWVPHETPIISVIGVIFLSIQSIYHSIIIISKMLKTNEKSN